MMMGQMISALNAHWNPPGERSKLHLSRGPTLRSLFNGLGEAGD